MKFRFSINFFGPQRRKGFKLTARASSISARMMGLYASTIDVSSSQHDVSRIDVS